MKLVLTIFFLDEDNRQSTKHGIDLHRNENDNNGVGVGGPKMEEIDESRVRIHDDEENNGTSILPPG